MVNNSAVISLFLFLTSLSTFNSVDAIIGGELVKPENENDYNYVVSVRLKELDDKSYGQGFLCNGALISSRLILTSAQCVYQYNSESSTSNKSNTLRNKIYDPKKIRVVLGNIYRTRPFKFMLHRDVARISVHTNFTGNGNYDVALLRLMTAIPTTAVGILPISLRSTTLTAGTACRVSGWGETSEMGFSLSDHLMLSSIEVLQNSECNSIWGGTLPSGMACVGNETNRVCNGDLGAPVICGRQLAGFVSRDTTCGVKPTLITSVASYRDWINRNGSWRVTVNYLLIAIGVIVAMIKV